MKKNILRLREFSPIKNLRNFLFFISLFSSLQTFAQVSGTIIGDGDLPLAGVSIAVKGTSQGTTSDVKGNYKISVPEDGTLYFSFIGYKSKEVKVSKRTVLNITLETDEKNLDEVVVVGYGTQKKSTLTGAVSSIGQKELKALPIVSFTQALQGRVPGVSITNNSGPGTEPVVRVRGVGSISSNPNPLYVVDGVPGFSGGLNTLDPKDIESLEVLKDASAASIYGSRAANGVILVTTKKGKSGKLKVTLDAYTGVQSAWKKLDLLNRDQYIQYGTALLGASGQAIPGRFANLNTPIYDGATTTFAQTDTDWQGELFREAPIRDVQVSLSGGSESSRFYASYGNFSQEGILPFTDYSRQSLRLNSDHQISKRITVGQTLLIGIDNRRLERTGGGRGLIMNIIRMTPYWPLRDPTKVGGFSRPTNGLDATDPENPLRIVEMEQQDQIEKNLKLNGTIYAEVKLASWLKYKFLIGVDNSNFTFNSFLPLYNDGNGSRPTALIAETRRFSYSKILTNQLTIDKTFGKHLLNVTLVGEQQDSFVTPLEARGQRPDNLVKVLKGVTNPTIVPIDDSESSLISYVGRLSYDYAGKYLLGATIRSDGSSRFAPGRKWGIFPSASIGWRMSEEPFLKEISAISELKLRASIGKTGFNAIGDYAYQPLVAANNTIYPFGNANQSGSFTNTLGNTDLGWEKTTMSNIGIDGSFLNNKIFVTAEWYKRQTDDLILAVPLPNSLGFSVNPLANVGSISNTGIELSAGYNYSSKDFNFKLTGTFDRVRNNVLGLSTPNSTINSGSNADFGSFDITRTEAGQPIQSFFGWQTNGIFQNQAEVDAANRLDGDAGTPFQNARTAPGDIRFKDLNGDNKIDANDRTYLGSYLPDFSYGINWGGNYKNFDFEVYFQGVQGNKIYNGTKVIGQGMLRLFNSTTDVLNAWTPTNTNTDVPRAVSGDPNQNTRTSDRFIEDGSYLRLKNLSIGYTLPSEKVKKLTGNVVNRVRFYVSSQNLLTFTKYTGYDPEVASQFGNLLNNGIDYGQYPQARTILFGVNFGFN
jgi:TonB-dependent starch-binding outer membrane protein SusC